jgi:DNA invertase Pin-like site-specific DNA recombinase
MLLIPAAQYLRMSTEHQQFSLQSQTATIKQYAETRGFTIVRSYEDPGKSGLVLKHRKGLAQLLHDVISGSRPFKAIFVYDISRWGRFQDTDESAHYEFVCRSAGVPVFYCAETFDNDGSLPTAIIKTLKRVMAAEYSRELSLRLSRTKTIMTEGGFRVGGMAGFGLRRMLIDCEGCPRKLLAHGEVKGVGSGRVILVPGPAKEVARVKEIYRLTISDRRSAKSIAREFNRKGITCGGAPWTYGRILEILKNPKYVGCAAWRRTTGILGIRRLKVPREKWIVNEEAFQPIIDRQTYDTAQRVLRDRIRKKSNDELLISLKKVLKREGKLSVNIIDASRALPSSATYGHRFGGLRAAYDLIGYKEFRNREGLSKMRFRHTKIKQALLRRILRAFSGDVRLVHEQNGCRHVLCFGDGVKVSVLISQCCKTLSHGLRWNIYVNRFEHSYVTLVARCKPNNQAFKDFYVFPRVELPSKLEFNNMRKQMFRIKENDLWLKNGKQLKDVSTLWRVAKQVRRPFEMQTENVESDQESPISR